MEHPFLTSGKSRIEFSPENGTIRDFTFDRVQLAVPASEAFSLRLVNGRGDRVRIGANEFSDFQWNCADGALHESWSGGTTYPDLAVEMTVRPGDDGFFCFRTTVRHIPADMELELIDAPSPAVPSDRELFCPYSEGVLANRTQKTTRKPVSMGGPDESKDMIYPGVCQMQFLASYNAQGGLYFAAADPAHTTKTVDFFADGTERVRLRIETACGGIPSGGEYKMPFELELGGFHGDWQNACEIYRRGVSSDPGMKRNFALPEWLNQSPVVLIYPVRGTGRIFATPNRLFPYEAALPRILELGKKLDSTIMPLLMRWDHGGPWQPPWYWPPLGGEEMLKHFIDELHRNGHLFGLYGSGTIFSRKSLCSDYSQEERFQSENLLAHMARGPKGESHSGVCADLREGCEMCIADPWCRDTLREQVELAAKAGVDFFQLLDQNLGAAAFNCYSREHHHPPVPGAWQTEAMRELIADLNRSIRHLNSRMILGTECAAAQPYIAGLPFNDLRDCIALGIGRPVPAYAYVFHQYLNNFAGNFCMSYVTIDCEKSPDNLQFRLAYSFSSGALLTLTLRDSGEIDWGAAADWSKPAPAQKPVIRLVERLNRMRKRYPQYLSAGKMLAPDSELESGTWTLHLRGDGEPLEFPSVLRSRWEAPDGSVAEFLVNYRETPEPVTLGGKHLTIPPLDCVVIGPRP